MVKHKASKQSECSKRAADQMQDSAGGSNQPALKKPRLDTYLPPIDWEAVDHKDLSDKLPDTVEYEYSEYGVKEKVRVELFDGSTRTEGAVRLLLKIDEYYEKVRAQTSNEKPAEAQLKYKKLKQWTSQPAKGHVEHIATEKFILDDEQHTKQEKTIGEWLQNGAKEEQLRAWKEARSRFIRHYAGEKPYDRQREYMQASLPLITLNATAQDMRDWYQRLETLSDYLPVLYEAQHPEAQSVENTELTAREKRELWLRKTDYRVSSHVKSQKSDIYMADFRDFQSWMEQGLLQAHLEQAKQKRLQKDIERNIGGKKAQGGSKPSTPGKSKGGNKKHCAHCEKIGKPPHIVRSHNEADCHNKGHPASRTSSNRNTGSVHTMKKKRGGRQKQKDTTSKKKKDDTTSSSDNTSSSESGSDYSSYSRPRKRVSTHMICMNDISYEKDSYQSYYIHPNNEAKRVKLTHFKNPKPELIVHMKARRSGILPEQKLVRALIDTGSDGTILLKKFTSSDFARKVLKSVPQTWNTKGGAFKTSRKADVSFTLPEFGTQRTIRTQVFVDTSTKSKDIDYDMIIGSDLLTKLGIDVCFSTYTIHWDGMEASMKEARTLSNRKELFNTYQEHLEPDSTKEATKRVIKILDARYEKANLDQVANAAEHLTSQQREQLLKLLRQYEDLFDGTLGEWNTQPVDFDLLPDAKPYHGKPFPVPKVHLDTLKKELGRLCNLSVLRKISETDDSREWAAQTFIIPKKNGTVRFVSDFRKLNRWLKRSPYPIPVIKDILLQLEGFTFASSLDLNMGYYTL